MSVLNGGNPDWQDIKTLVSISQSITLGYKKKSIVDNNRNFHNCKKLASQGHI